MGEQKNQVDAPPGDAERPRWSGAAALGHGGRMSRQRKSATVLRVVRGEALETVSRGQDVEVTVKPPRTRFRVGRIRHGQIIIGAVQLALSWINAPQSRRSRSNRLPDSRRQYRGV